MMRAHPSDRAGRASPQAPSGLGHAATIDLRTLLDELFALAEAGRAYWDASFYVGMCESFADPAKLESGTLSREEYDGARQNLDAARDEMGDAESALTVFSGPSGWPMSHAELLAKFAPLFDSLASVDTHPEGGDSPEAPFMGGAVRDSGDARPSAPSPTSQQEGQ